jgi:hypothetical protein
MGRLILACAYSQNGQKFRKPRVVVLQEDAIKITTPRKLRNSASVVPQGAAKVEEILNGIINRYITYDKAFELEAQRNLSSSDIIVKQVIALGLTGAGTTQGAGTALTKYFNETTTIGAAATEAFVLPAATIGKVCWVVNNDAAGDAAKIFPASGEFIGDQAVNTVYSLPSGSRICLVCTTTAGKWVIADDFTK